MPWFPLIGFADHLEDPEIRIVESNEDVLLFETGHIPGAVHIDWRADLNDQTIRDYVDTQGVSGNLPPQRDHARYHGGLLRRQVELVGMLRFLGLSALRAYQCETTRWRP